MKPSIARKGDPVDRFADFNPASALRDTVDSLQSRSRDRLANRSRERSGRSAKVGLACHPKLDLPPLFVLGQACHREIRRGPLGLTRWHTAVRIQQP